MYVRDFNIHSRDFSRRRQPRGLCQGGSQLYRSVELMRSMWNVLDFRRGIDTVSYTHLDVYKRQVCE